MFLILDCDDHVRVIQDSKHIGVCEMGELEQEIKKAAAQGAQDQTEHVAAFPRSFPKSGGLIRPCPIVLKLGLG